MAAAENGGRATAVSGDRQKISKVLRKQGLSQAQADAVINSSGAQDSRGRRSEMLGRSCWVKDSEDTPGGLTVTWDPPFEVELAVVED